MSVMSCTLAGRALQAAGPAQPKARSPSLVRVVRLTYLAVCDERRPSRRLDDDVIGDTHAVYQVLRSPTSVDVVHQKSELVHYP